MLSANKDSFTSFFSNLHTFHFTFFPYGIGLTVQNLVEVVKTDKLALFLNSEGQ